MWRTPLACGRASLRPALSCATLDAPRGVAQLVARLVWDQEVESSNLSAPTLTVDKRGGQKNFSGHLPLGDLSLANLSRGWPPWPSVFESPGLPYHDRLRSCFAHFLASVRPAGRAPRLAWPRTDRTGAGCHRAGCTPAAGGHPRRLRERAGSKRRPRLDHRDGATGNAFPRPSRTGFSLSKVG